MKQTLDFLSKLKENNNREWFHANKAAYESGFVELKEFVSTVIQGLSAYDVIDEPASKIFRINRDVRFSKDKTPYTKHRSAFIRRAGEIRRGSYYLRIENGGTRIAGGFFGPQPADLLHIRKQIQQEPEVITELFNQPEFKRYFAGLQGTQLKTAPRGFNADDLAINWIRHKQFFVQHAFTDKEARSDEFAAMVIEGYVKMRPFLDYMTELLITDLNGEPLF